MVTSDVMKLLKTSPEEAERLKVQSGAASPKVVPDGEPVDVLQLGQAHPRPLHRRVLCEIVESRMREIAQMIRQEIGNSGQFGNLPGGVVVTGGGSKLAGTAVLFEDVFPEHRVRVGEPTLLGAKSDFVNNPAMATTVGLALFVARSYDDELSPAAGAGDWKERIRTFWSLVSGPA